MNKEEFKKKILTIDKKGREDLYNWLEEMDYLNAPASAKYHGNFKGGLFKHCNNVHFMYDKLMVGAGLKKPPEESVFIVSYLHDVCKLGAYQKEKGKYVYTKGFDWNAGHGRASVNHIERFIVLTHLERAMILSHMGIYTTDYPIDLVKTNFQDLRVKLFYFADELATHGMERKDG